MRNIIIFNQNISISSAYGIGAFIKIFTKAFNSTDLKIYLVESCSKSSELKIYTSKKVTKLIIPLVNGTNEIINILPLYIQDINNSVMFMSYFNQFKIAEYLKKRTNIQFIGVIHSFSWAWKLQGNEEKLYRKVKHKSDQAMIETFLNEKKTLQYFDKIIALSNDSLNILDKVYDIDKSKLALIPNGIKDSFEENISKNKIRHELHINLSEKIILYVGRLDKLKGIDTLVSAFNKLIDNYEDCRLIFIGDGQFDTISNQLGKSASRIIFTGRISQKELKKWYQIADIAVLPSLSEECSFVGIEMLMHGLPIISTNGRGVRNMFHDMKNSLTVDCRKGKDIFEKELYETMLKLLTDENLANDLRKKARQWYLDNYQFKHMKHQYLTLVDEIADMKLQNILKQ